MKNNKVLYRHLKPSGEVFYIGVGSLIRPYSMINRNKFWHNIVNKYGYEVQILKSDLSWEDVCELEKILISWYGRRDLGTGPLVNLTSGGDGVTGPRPNHKPMLGKIHSQETKNKISKSKIGSKTWNKGLTNIYSEESKSKMSKKKLGVKTPRHILLSLNTGIYYSISEASEVYGLSEARIVTWRNNPQRNKTDLIFTNP